MDIIKICFTIFAAFLTFCSADEAGEISQNSVELTFYRLQKSEWQEEKMETKVHALLAAEANKYCANNPRDCGMITCCTSAFKEGEIGKVANYPQNEEKNMLYKFYIKIPIGSNVDNTSSLTYVLSSSTVIAIVEDARMDIFDSIERYITWANDVFFGIPPARTENIIMIIIAFLVLILVIVLALVLHYWNKRREHKEKLEKKMVSRKSQKKPKIEKVKTSKSDSSYHTETESPVYNVEKDIKPAGPPDAKLMYIKDRDSNTKKQEEERKMAMYQDTGIKSPRKDKGASNISDTDSAIKMDDTRQSNGELESAVGRQHASLPPLKTEHPVREDTAEEEEVKKERKKKKKEKKHRKKRSHSEGRSNEGYVDESKDTTEL